jgi:DNA-binding IclR family transcriptional regulator
MEVLKTLAAMGGGASLTALAARVGESPAKVHRYLASLVEAEFVLQEAVTSRYVLGPEAIAVGLAAMRHSDVLELGAAELARLAQSHHLSCFVSVLGSHGPTVVRWFEPIQTVTVNVKTGSVMPVLWSATGRAFGAFIQSSLLDAAVQKELAEATPERRLLLPDQHAVDALFTEIRSLRCAPIRDVLLVGVSAVAVPIFNADGRLAAVLTALGTSGSFDPTPGGSTSLVVRQAADSVSTRLGFRPQA